MLEQLNLLSEDFTEQPWRTGEIAFSVSKSQTEILRWISKLYLGGKPFHADVTYSKGMFYRDFPAPRLRYDIAPQSPDVRQADCRHLPLEDNSVESIMFDPPFKASHSNTIGLIEARFSAYGSIPELWEFYRDALMELYRVLQPMGIVVVKCQDGVYSGKNWFSHFEILKCGEQLGFITEDLFVLLATSVMLSPNVTPESQRHARKTHSFFIVLRKPK